MDGRIFFSKGGSGSGFVFHLVVSIIRVASSKALTYVIALSLLEDKLE